MAEELHTQPGALHSCRREKGLLNGSSQRFQTMVLVIIDLVSFNINNKNHSHEITVKLKRKIVLAVSNFSGLSVQILDLKFFLPKNKLIKLNFSFFEKVALYFYTHFINK